MVKLVLAEAYSAAKPWVSLLLHAVAALLWLNVVPWADPLLLFFALPGLAFGVAIVAYTLVLSTLRHLDTKKNRAGYIRLCRLAWETPVVVSEEFSEPNLTPLRKTALPPLDRNRCWCFEVISNQYPRYVARGYLLPDEDRLHLALVIGLPGQWHEACYCTASCEVEGSVYRVNQLYGPLKGWIGQGSQIGLDLNSDSPSIYGQSFGHLKVSVSNVPPVLRRFANMR
ncbi:hypothetical protein SAMN05216279_12733 [Pseudomonas oryzihabitans]|uniref:Uncharacterized protein n=1 Tax=Pseudomonas oryzihabitans TaxID=47885 RepID=A0A1G5PGB2_9PSED|nr:hypothetical protein SAMN05216279_12733 [Pseudomonas psychrotolerans]